MERFSGDGERLLLVYRVVVHVEVEVEFGVWLLLVVVVVDSGETRRVCQDL